MAAHFIDCAQGSAEWHEARRGIPTASMFDKVMARGRGGKSSEERNTYLYQLAAERITGEPMPGFSTPDTRRGHQMEDEARQAYAVITGNKVERVGFVLNGRAGASPDSRIVGQNGGQEIKTKLPHHVIKLIIEGGDSVPPEHIAQVQGQIEVCDFDFIDLTIYWPKITPIIVRTRRDAFVCANIRGEINRFNDELDLIVEQVQRYGRPLAEAA